MNVLLRQEKFPILDLSFENTGSIIVNRISDMTQFSCNKGLLTFATEKFLHIKYYDNGINRINIGDNCHSERDK